MAKITYFPDSDITYPVSIKTLHEWATEDYGNNYTKFRCIKCGLKKTAIEDSPCTWLEFNKEPCIHG